MRFPRAHLCGALVLLCAAAAFAGSNCSPGYYDNDSGCRPCSTGRYQPYSGQSSCYSCDIGKFQDQTGQTSCKSCTVGKYNDLRSQATCKDCASGFWSADIGRTTPCSTPWRTCTAGQFQAADGTTSTDRQCLACPSGRFSVTTNALQCTLWTPCAAGSEERLAPTASTDRTCASCPTGKYNTQGGNPCIDWSTCSPGSEQVAPGTTSSDRVCRSCPSGKYSNSQTGNVCVDWTPPCSSGNFESRPPSASVDRACDPCAPGSFQDTSGQTTCKLCNGVTEFQDNRGQISCKPATLCAAGSGELVRPTTTSNRVCVNCQLGSSYGTANNVAPCQAVSTCPAGTQVSAAPTLSSDRVCMPCPQFTFNAVGGNTQCQAITACTESEWMTKEHTPTSDRQCTTVSLCRNGLIDGTSVPCSCPGGSTCEECLVQPSSTNGLLLVQDGGTPKVSASLDPSSPIQFIPSNIEPLAGCRDLCQANTSCNSFNVHLSGESRGACFLRRSYTVTRGIDITPPTAFYAMPTCSKCVVGYTVKDRSCSLQALPPAFDAFLPSSIRMPLSTAIGTQIVRINATSPDGNGPVTYSLAAVGGDVASINSTTGVITITAAPSVAGTVALTITATDSRKQCPTASAQGLVSGGCTSTFALSLEFISFVSCPNDIDQYLDPSKTSAVVSWARPLLPSIYSSINVTSSLGAWQSAYSFNVGSYVVTYSTPALDLGAAVTCQFKVRIQYGFALSVETIGHIATDAYSLDFILDDGGLSNGGAQVPSFYGDVVGQGLSIGILSPPKKPFSLFLRPNFRTQLQVSLQWCSTGTFPSNLTGFVSKRAQFEFVGLISPRAVTLNDTGSGYLSNGRCFQILAASNVITENLSFVSINIRFNIPGGARRRRASPTLNTYFPVNSNMVFFQFSQITPVLPLVDPGAMLTLEDKMPPQWLNCPALPIRVTAPRGNDSAVVVWEKPDAVDNVAVLSTTATATPGSLFSIVGSPHKVTYTAYDANQAGYCIFYVYVDFEPFTFSVSDTVGENYTSDVRQNSALGMTVATHVLSGGAKTAIPSFAVDLGAYTELVFRFAAEEGDAVAVRTRSDALYGQIDFDLQWRVAGKPITVIPQSTDVEASFEFESFAQDTAAVTKANTTLAVKNRIENTKIVLDPAGGLVQIKGQSANYQRGFSFTSLNIRLRYPKSRASLGSLTYAQVAGSQIGFRYFYSGTAGPSSSYVGFLTLLDTERPVFETCPRNQTLRTDARSNTKAVTWSAPLVSDNRGPPMVTSTHSPGSLFAVKARGDPGHQVVYTARDLYGNTATCSFYVLVEDREAPRLTCPPPLTYDLAPGAKTFTVAQASLRPTTILDNVQTANFVIQYPAVLSLGVGSTTLPVAARDDWLNTGSCQVSVTIQDREPPKVTCPQMNPVPEDGQKGYALVRWNDVLATDNDRVVSVNSTHQSNTTFPVGTTEVVVAVVDASGNRANCSFIVEIVGTPKLEGSTGSTATTAAGGGAGAAAVLLIVVLFLLYRARQAAKRPQRWEEIFALMSQFKENEEDACIPREISRDAVRIVSELGKGAFGLVCKGILQESASIPGYLVAVKSLIPGSTASDRQELLEEAAVMAQFNSPFVVQLVGVVTIGKPLLVVLEFMELGDLKSYLEKSDLDEVTRVMFAGDVCEGIHHIHTKGFLHRDIAARNVLISSERRCKISDFGLAREQEDDTYYRSKGGNLPVRWSAPEALEERKFNHATEIWSFGIVMYEIWTKAALPYKDWHNQKVWVEVSNGYRLPCPAGCEKDLFEMMLRCWCADPHERIEFEEMIAFLRARWSTLRGDPEPDGYLETSTDVETTDTMRRQTLFSRLLSGVRRSMSRNKLKDAGRTSSVSSSKTSKNPAFEEDDFIDNNVLYSMASPSKDEGDRTIEFSSGSAGPLYDMGNFKEDAGAPRGGSSNADARALYDLGDIKEKATDSSQAPSGRKSGPSASLQNPEYVAYSDLKRKSSESEGISFGFVRPEDQSLYDNNGVDALDC